MVTYAVIDVETTGLGRYDRIVEFACLTISNNRVVDEYDTLIQPERDPGPTHIHNITPSMLQSAPTFETVAGDVATRLNGAVLVAHNLPFDVRMLTQETERVGRAPFNPGQGICTYQLTGEKLSVAARNAGLTTHDAHTALSDARTAYELLTGYRLKRRRYRPAKWPIKHRGAGVTIRRPNAPPRRGSLHQLAERASWPPNASQAEVLYLDALDRCLDDGVLEPSEHTWLDATAQEIGLTHSHRVRLHENYYQMLEKQINADGIVTAEEQKLAVQVASALELPRPLMQITASEPSTSDLPAGMTVCFTGSSTLNGEPLQRKHLEAIAKAFGLVPRTGVSRKLGMLVAADPMSQSGKAKKARHLNVPVVSVNELFGLM